MPFIEITGKGVRNLDDFKIRPAEKINVIFGENGAGKTNFLELIYLNSLGKSFRTNLNGSIIRDSEDSCVVFSKYLSGQPGSPISRLGLEKHRKGKQKISINGLKDKDMADLAQLVPVLVIQPNETDLIDGSSSQRRRYLDWLLFHVEPEFFACWKKSERLLKQRNHLLRQSKTRSRTGASILEQKAWDIQFVSANEALNALREPYINPLQKVINEHLELFPTFAWGASNSARESSTARPALNIDFFVGWQRNKLLLDLLDEELNVDINRGYTKSGSHRCDLIISAKGHPARDYLSRGQKKLLALAMRLAQAKILMSRHQIKPVLLIDDLFAELDEKNARTFCSLLESLNTQVFLTSVGSRDDHASFFKEKPAMFHVEQGRIQAL